MILTRRELLLASLHNQYLTGKAPCRTVASELCGLQAQFANNPRYALLIRSDDFSPERWNKGLVKTWTFRGTLHAVLEDELGLFLSAREEPGDWHDGWGIGDKRMEYWAMLLLELIEAGVCERGDLKAACLDKGMAQAELNAVFHGWGGALYELCVRGRIAYACDTAKRFVRCPAFERIPLAEARAELARRYFKAFGPATAEDFAYFTGWKKRETQAVIENIGLEMVECDGTEYFCLRPPNLAGDIPPCLFLAGFDQLLMGYKDRSRLMDERFKADVTNSSGIVHPTILLEGRVKARWNKHGKRITITPFTRISQRDRKRILKRAEELFEPGSQIGFEGDYASAALPCITKNSLGNPPKAGY